METVRSSETSVWTYDPTQRQNPEWYLSKNRRQSLETCICLGTFTLTVFTSVYKSHIKRVEFILKWRNVNVDDTKFC